jgi:hypothetical protein
LAACVGGGYIYTSADHGSTWTQRYIYAFWNSIASSYPKSPSYKPILAASEAHSYGVHMSFDGGENWIFREFVNKDYIQITQLAITLDGSKLAALASNWSNYMYVSIDYGDNWIKRYVGNGYILEVSWSVNNSKLFVCSHEWSGKSAIYTSEDYGANWTKIL